MTTKIFQNLFRFRLDKFTTFLLTKLPCNLLHDIFAALSFTFNLLSIELVFTPRVSIELSSLRSFFSLRHLSIHLNVKDVASFQSRNKTFTKIKKPILNKNIGNDSQHVPNMQNMNLYYAPIFWFSWVFSNGVSFHVFQDGVLFSKASLLAELTN